VSETVPGPAEWQDVDESGLAESATAYLDDAANALGAARLRSHESLGIGRGASVLDVGCGTGIALAEIAALVGAGGTVVGVDPSEAMLAAACARLEGAPCTVELVTGDALATGLSAERFDAVRTERVLMHVADLEGAVAELARVTKRGGRLVLVEPDHRQLALDTDDRDFWATFLVAFGKALANISAGTRLPAIATGQGLHVVSIEVVPYQFCALDAFVKVFDFEVGRPMVLAEGIEDARYDQFLDEQRERDAQGRFLAVGVMYVVTVEKP
jgi:SAM-dependent methyltransferase